MNTIRVRFAPSPTGHMHLGSLRTVLYNWLYARHTQGTFLLRIEDTDVERSKEEYTVSIFKTLEWMSMMPDEPAIIQSDRLESHQQIAQKLLNEGKAYRCFCTPEELRERLGESAAHEGSYVRYDEKCRTRQVTEADLLLPFALRFKVPADRTIIAFNDLIRGPIEFEREQIDDFIIVRSDGMPTYNFVVVVDDAFMRISHVLRGEDHIPNTPKQIVLYEACGYALPEFGHFSMILGPDGHRLSKRHGVKSILEYKEEGFLAHALMNYLVRLGWSHGDQEIFTVAELITYFSLEHMSKKGAIFDSKKLEWINGHYLRAMGPEALVNTIEADIEPGWSKKFVNWSAATLHSMIELYKERSKTLRELMNDLSSLHGRPHEFAADATTIARQEVVDHLKKVQEVLYEQEDFSAAALEQTIKNLAATLQVPIRQIAEPLRIALTGHSSSPGIAHIIALLGQEESTQRIEYFREYLERSMKH